MEQVRRPALRSCFNRDAVLSMLRAHQPELVDRGVTHLWIFGSIARDAAGEHSDIDVMIEPGEKFSLFDLCTVREFLQRVCRRPVDVLTRSTIRRSQFAKRVLAEAVRAF